MRIRLPNRRASIAFSFEHEGHRYRASTSRFPDGRLAEIFLDAGKGGSAVQANAQTSAMLASLLLQNGVSAASVRRSISGPIALALQLAEAL